jgi:hypothetical protein
LLEHRQLLLCPLFNIDSSDRGGRLQNIPHLCLCRARSRSGTIVWRRRDGPNPVQGDLVIDNTARTAIRSMRSSWSASPRFLTA